MDSNNNNNNNIQPNEQVLKLLEEIKKLPVATLKERLEDRGLPKTGLKPELIHRLRNSIEQENALPLSPFVPKEKKQTTPKKSKEEKAVKGEKGEKREKGEKAEKAEKGEKGEKAQKVKKAKLERPAFSSSSESSDYDIESSSSNSEDSTVCHQDFEADAEEFKVAPKEFPRFSREGYKQKLYMELDRVTSGGDYMTSGVVPLKTQTVTPSISITAPRTDNNNNNNKEEEITISWPLSDETAEQIKKVATKAPFGVFDKTIQNEEVRSTFQIEPINIKFFNLPSWSSFLDTTIRNNLIEGLGLSTEADAVSLNLYKLLLYEKGSFFKPHKDTPKEDDMVGTLVIILPSKFSGGDIEFTFQGKKKSVGFSATKKSLHYCGFFADVVHEIKPIKSGHRIALVYNILERAQHKRTSIPTGPREKLNKYLFQEKEFCFDQYLCWVFDHQYNLKSFAQKGKWALKGTDLQRALLIEKAVAFVNRFADKKSQWIAYLGIIEREMHWDVSSNCDPGVQKFRLEGFGLDSGSPLGKVPDPSKVNLINHKDLLKKFNKMIKTREVAAKFSVPEDIITGNEGGIEVEWYHQACIFIGPKMPKRDKDSVGKFYCKYQKDVKDYEKKERQQYSRRAGGLGDIFGFFAGFPEDDSDDFPF